MRYNDILDKLRYCKSLFVRHESDNVDFARFYKDQSTGDVFTEIKVVDVTSVLGADAFELLCLSDYDYRIVSVPKHPSDWSWIVIIEIFKEDKGDGAL